MHSNQEGQPIEGNPGEFLQAVILCGGLGTRLLNTVPALPKALAPVGGPPFFDYLLTGRVSYRPRDRQSFARQSLAHQSPLRHKLGHNLLPCYLLLYCEYEKKHKAAEALRKIGGAPAEFSFEFHGWQTWRMNGHSANGPG